MRRTVLMLLSLGLIAYGVYLYANLGTFEPLGYYNHFAVYRWRPTGIAVVFSLLSILSGALVYHFSNLPRERDYKISTMLALSMLYIPFFITRVLEKSFNFVNMQRTPITTDSIWLQYGAAKALLKGLNPYIVDFKEVLLKYADPSALTWIYKGGYSAHNIVGFVTHYDYLPTGFLYYLPAALFNINPNIWNIIVFGAFIIFLYARIRPLYSPLYAAILSAGMFIYFFEPIRYTPDTGWLVPLLIAIMAPRHPRLSGALLAWAATYRPYVAVFLPFYFIMLYYENYDWKTTLKSFTISSLIITLPFFVINPGAFIKGVLIPFTSNFSPYDTIAPGIISLHYLGIDITPFVLKATMLALFSLLIYIAAKKYHGIKYTLFVFPLLVLIFYPRPSYVYYIYFPFAGVIAHVTGFFEGSKPPHHRIREIINSIKSDLTKRKPLIQQHAEFSAHAVSMATMGLFLLLEFAYEFLEIRIAVTVIVMLLPVMMYVIATKTNITKYAVPTMFALLLFIGGVVLYSVPAVYYIFHNYYYSGDYYWLTVYAAKDILSLKNPYFQHHLADLMKETFFGDAVKLVKGSYHIVTPALGHYHYPPGKGYTLYWNNGWTPIDFYDYPPLLALFAALSILLGLNPGALYNLVFIIAIIVFAYRIRNNVQRTILSALLITGYALSTVAFSAFSNSVLYTAFLILMITYAEKPKVSGAFAGLAAMTMPQAGLFILFWLIYLFKRNYTIQYFKNYIITAMTTAAIVFLPFGWRHPVEVAKRMFFPVIAKLQNNEFNGIGIANILNINYGVPSEYFIPLAATTFIILVYIALKKEFQMKEIMLLFPVYVFMFFPRTIISYVVFYFLLETLAWSKSEETGSTERNPQTD